MQRSAGVEALAVAPAATAANAAAAAAAAAPAPRADRDKKGYRTNPFRSVGKDGNESQIVKAGAKISPPSSRGTRVSPPASKSSKEPEDSSCVGSRTRRSVTAAGVRVSALLANRLRCLSYLVLFDLCQPSPASYSSQRPKRWYDPRRDRRRSQHDQVWGPRFCGDGAFDVKCSSDRPEHGPAGGG